MGGNVRHIGLDSTAANGRSKRSSGGTTGKSDVLCNRGRNLFTSYPDFQVTVACVEETLAFSDNMNY
jgi:hypothetical protein